MMSTQNYDGYIDASYRQPYRNGMPVQPLKRPSCPANQMSQEQLLYWIAQTKFACVDANLYLDTHPQDVQAIRYFQENNRLYMEAMDEYARLYGPLTLNHTQTCNTWWEWVNQPWPWQ